MSDAHMLAIDLAKRSFQVCATDQAGSVLYNRTVSRSKLEALLKGQPRCIVAMEACATSHFWGRFAGAGGHEVRLIPPIYVKPFVKRQKYDGVPARTVVDARLGLMDVPVGGGKVSLSAFGQNIFNKRFNPYWRICPSTGYRL